MLEEGAEQAALAHSRFVDIAFGAHCWERAVDIDTILGELYSTSFANKALLGEQADTVEAEVRRSLLGL